MGRFRTRRRAASARSLPRKPARASGEQDGPPAGVVLGACAFDPLRATLTLSPRGGLVIPVELRRALAIEAGGALVVEATADGLLLRPFVAFECDSDALFPASVFGPARRRRVN
jgi:hypothetical protein